MRVALMTCVVGLLALAPASATAATHTVRFGGDLGNVYEPQMLTVSAGDTVEWVGDFGINPLQYRLSALDPLSAPFTGPGPFRRTFTAAGDRFEYQSSSHGSQGMYGTVIVAGRADPRPLIQPPLLTLSTRPGNPVAHRPVTIHAEYVAGSGDYTFDSFGWDLDNDGQVLPAGGVDRITTEPEVTLTFGRAGVRKVTVIGSAITPGNTGTTRASLTFEVAGGPLDREPASVRALRLDARTVESARRSGLLLRFRGSEPATLTGDVRLKGDVIARIPRRRIGVDGTRVRVRFNALGRRLLRGRQSARLSLHLRLQDAAGNQTAVQRTLRLA